MRFSLAALIIATTGPSTRGDVPMIGETIVTASPIESDDDQAAKGSTSKINAAQLLERGSVSLPDALQREPGVSVPFDTAGVDSFVPYLQGGNKSINIRGLDGNRISMLVDGIRQPEDFTSRSFEGAGGPGRIYFDPAVFSQIELFKSATFGSDALGGAVSGTTESPWTILGPDLVGRTLKTNSTFASSNQSFNQRIATAWGNGDLATSAVYSFRTGHEQETAGSLKANPSDFESHALVWKTVLRRGDWTIEPTLDVFRSTDFTDLRSLQTASSIGTTIDANNDSERERYRASLDLHYEPSAAVAAFDDLRGNFYFQSSSARNLNRQFLELNTGGFRDRLNDIFYDTDIAGLNIEARKEVEDHQISYSYRGSRSEIASSLLRTDNGQPTENFPGLAPSTVWRNELVLSDEITLDRWTIAPTLRLEHYQVSPENTDDFLALTTSQYFDGSGNIVTRTVRATDYANLVLSPSLTVGFQATDALEIYGSYARGFRNPSAEELAGVFVHPDNLSITLPNPDLEEENSHSFELGLKHRGDFTTVHFSTFYNQYGNFLESNVATGEFVDGLDVRQTVNARNAKIYGVELKTDWDIGEQFSSLAGLSTGSSLAYSKGTSEGAPLNSIEPFKAVAYLAYNHPDQAWGAELSGTYLAGKEASDINGDISPTDPYFLLDLTAYYQLSDQLTLRAGLKNILDQEYTLWSRANRGEGHGGGGSDRNTQPGINGFFSVEMKF